MLTAEILAQVRKIEIQTGRMVSELFAGRYQSVFKGLGMEFSEVREYTPGDDVRAIDWNVTARAGHPFIKRFTEERELTVMVVCDLSASLRFGSQFKQKRQLAAEIASLLAFAALRNNDKVGLALTTDQVELYVAPRKGRLHALRVIRDLLAFEPAHTGTALGPALSRINRSIRRRGIMFLISDFADVGFEHDLRVTAKRHDLVPIWVQDPREVELPKMSAMLEIEDPETGERRLIDPGDSALRESYKRERAAARAEVERQFRACGLDWITVHTDRPYVADLVRFFSDRAKRFR